jgi:hypothetical protein
MEIGKIDEVSVMSGLVYYRVPLNQSAPFTIRTKNINHGEAGTILVHCIGVDEQGRSMTGAKKASFEKSSAGVLVMDNVQNDIAIRRHTAMNGTDFNIITTQDGHIAVTVTGTAVPKIIGWQIVFIVENTLSMIYF